MDSIDLTRVSNEPLNAVYTCRLYPDSLIVALVNVQDGLRVLCHKLGGRECTLSPTGLIEYTFTGKESVLEPLRFSDTLLAVPLQLLRNDYLQSDSTWKLKFDAPLAAVYSISKSGLKLIKTFGSFPKSMRDGRYYYDVSGTWCLVNDDDIAVAFPFEKQIRVYDMNSDRAVQTIEFDDPSVHFEEYDRSLENDALYMTRYYYEQPRFWFIGYHKSTQTIYRSLVPGGEAGSTIRDYSERDWRLILCRNNNCISLDISGGMYSPTQLISISPDSTYLVDASTDGQMKLHRVSIDNYSR